MRGRGEQRALDNIFARRAGGPWAAALDPMTLVIKGSKPLGFARAGRLSAPQRQGNRYIGIGMAFALSSLAGRLFERLSRPAGAPAAGGVGGPAGDALDRLEIAELRERPRLWERVIRRQQQEARSDGQVRLLLESLYLTEDRAGDFERFRKSREFAAVLRLLDIFGAAKGARICEVGAGPGYLSWALLKEGFEKLEVLEPNAHRVTGTGYLRSRADAAAIAVHDDVAAWAQLRGRCNVLLTRNCIHHFENITRAAVMLRRGLAPGGKWLAIREWYADSAGELALNLGSHPYCQPYKMYEWPYPAAHYASAVALAGFRLEAVVPIDYDGNCLASYSEGPPSAASQAATAEVERLLRESPGASVEAFWQEDWDIRMGRRPQVRYTRPQALLFSRVEVTA